jgi:hypothetical protein
MFFKKKVDEGRAKQIKDLRSSFPSLRRPQNDDSIFDMLFEVDKAYSTLRVYIHPDFPNSKPGLLQMFSDVMRLFEEVILQSTELFLSFMHAALKMISTTDHFYQQMQRRYLSDWNLFCLRYISFANCWTCDSLLAGPVQTGHRL